MSLYKSLQSRCLERDTLRYLLDRLVFDLKALTQNLADVGVMHVREGLEDRSLRPAPGGGELIETLG